MNKNILGKFLRAIKSFFEKDNWISMYMESLILKKSANSPKINIIQINVFSSYYCSG